MVDWNGPGRIGKWQKTDLFNLIGIDPNTAIDLTWVVLESRKRKLVSKLHLHNSNFDMPKGGVEKTNQEHGEIKLVLERAAVTEATEKEQKRVLAKILEDGWEGYEKIWHPECGVLDNWVGERRMETGMSANYEMDLDSTTSEEDGRASGSRAKAINLSAHAKDAEDETADAPVYIDSDDD